MEAAKVYEGTSTAGQTFSPPHSIRKFFLWPHPQALTGTIPTKPTFLQSSLVLLLGSVWAYKTMAGLKFSLIQQTRLLTHSLALSRA